MGYEAAETDLRRGAAREDRDLGRRSRAARQRIQDRRWRPAGMDVCLDSRSKTGMRVENRL